MARKGNNAAHAAAAALDLFMAHRPPPQDGSGWGVELQRFVEPKDWPRALEERVPAEHRAGAEEYLRGIAARMRIQRDMARRDGFTDVAEWLAYRRGLGRPG